MHPHETLAGQFGCTHSSLTTLSKWDYLYVWEVWTFSQECEAGEKPEDYKQGTWEHITIVHLNCTQKTYNHEFCVSVLRSSHVTDIVCGNCSLHWFFMTIICIIGDHVFCLLPLVIISHHLETEIIYWNRPFIYVINQDVSVLLKEVLRLPFMNIHFPFL